MNLDQKMKLYDNLYRHADILIKKHNPCKIENGQCLRGTPCCDCCEHLTEDGCSINCLLCKLALCYRVDNLALIRSLVSMWKKADRNDLLHIRRSRKEVFEIIKEKEKKKSTIYIMTAKGVAEIHHHYCIQS